MAPASVSIAAREVGATLHAIAIHAFPVLLCIARLASTRLCATLFPPRTLWDKAPPAAADNRPPARGVLGRRLRRRLFLCLINALPEARCRNERTFPRSWS